MEHEYQVIIGIDVDDKRLDYCREQVMAGTDDMAVQRARDLVSSAQLPAGARGSLVVRRIELWGSADNPRSVTINVDDSSFSAK